MLAEYQDLWTSSTTAGGMQLGSQATTGDGRRFIFVLAGATALVPGKLQQSPVETTGWEALNPGAVAIGAVQFTTTSTVTVTANAWAGGYLNVTQTPGQGYQYKIKGNSAATSAVSTVYLSEADPIQVALTTGSQIDIIASPYNGTIVNPTAATGSITGVAIYPVAAAQYGWIQTSGPANVLAQGTIVVGEQVAASSTTAGAVVATSGVLASVGYAITGIATTDYGAVMLNIL